MNAQKCKQKRLAAELQANGGLAEGGEGSNAPQQNQAEQKEAEAEGRREIMSQILSNEARERLARIQLVRPSRAQDISNLLLRMAQSGQYFVQCYSQSDNLILSQVSNEVCMYQSVS